MAVTWLLSLPTRMLAEGDWQQQVRTAVERHQIPAALVMVDHRLADAPDDMDAHSWRGKLLGWTGHWREAEIEYEHVLEKFSYDIDVLTGLSDVLLWQQKYSESLAVLDKARRAAPKDPEILVRRARVLSLLRRNAEARAEFRAALNYDPTNRAAIVDPGGDVANIRKAIDQLKVTPEKILLTQTAGFKGWWDGYDYPKEGEPPPNSARRIYSSSRGRVGRTFPSPLKGGRNRGLSSRSHSRSRTPDGFPSRCR